MKSIRDYINLIESALEEGRQITQAWQELIDNELISVCHQLRIDPTPFGQTAYVLYNEGQPVMVAKLSGGAPNTKVFARLQNDTVPEGWKTQIDPLVARLTGFAAGGNQASPPWSFA